MPVVMISGHGTIEMAVAAIQQRRLRFHREAVQVRPAAAGGARALEAAALAQRERGAAPARRARESNLTGEGNGIASLRAAIEKVAPTGSRVLIPARPAAARRSWRA